MKPQMNISLAEKSRQYWILSSMYNGRMGKGVTCEQVNKVCNSLYPSLNPQRPLYDRLLRLQQEVIRGPEHASVNNSAAN